MPIDPDLLAILMAAAFAGLLFVGRLPGTVRRRRELTRLCSACGRRLIQGTRTCDCDG